MKKIIMILLVVFGLGVGSRAQAQMLNLNYQMSLPLGDQHDFISKMSFRGFSMDYHYFLSERLAVGASLGWNTLYKHLDYATGHFTMNGEKVTISDFRGKSELPAFFFSQQVSHFQPHFSPVGSDTDTGIW